MLRHSVPWQLLACCLATQRRALTCYYSEEMEIMNASEVGIKFFRLQSGAVPLRHDSLLCHYIQNNTFCCVSHKTIEIQLFSVFILVKL